MRSLFTLLWWSIATPLTALVMFPYTLVSGNIEPMYAAAMWIARKGVALAGVRVDVAGRERLDPRQSYVFLSNHASNLDPPALIPELPNRTSVLVKKQLFRIPVLGRAMRMGSFVPVDRSNRQSAIESLAEAVKIVVHHSVSMTIFVEGTRSYDGRLLPFKKGPFHLALDLGLPVVPVTIVGTERLLPKGKSLATPGTVRVVFHEPIDPTAVGERDALIELVRERIASALPAELR